jgi:hypothetical protein
MLGIGDMLFRIRPFDTILLIFSCHKPPLILGHLKLVDCHIEPVPFLIYYITLRLVILRLVAAGSSIWIEFTSIILINTVYCRICGIFHNI